MKVAFALLLATCICLASAFPAPKRKVGVHKGIKKESKATETVSKAQSLSTKLPTTTTTSAPEEEPEKEVEMIAIIKNEETSSFYTETEEESSYQAEQKAAKTS